MMMDIIFDFSSSYEGGSLWRLHAYAEYFANSKLSTHFFISSGLKDPARISDLVPTTAVAKNGIDKLLVRNKHLMTFASRPKWLFSYGLPVWAGFGEKNWMHVSNALPFFFRECTLKNNLKIKSRLQEIQFKFLANNNDVISGESQFSIDRYCLITDYTGDTFMARNGVTPFEFHQVEKEPFALAVGIHSFKRIDLTHALFRSQKTASGIEKLVVIGNQNGIPQNLKSAEDVTCLGFVPQEELISAFQRARLFISTSEVENSSLAVLEGLTLTGKALLSDIPSHREMLEHAEVREFTFNNKPYLDVRARPEMNQNLPNWPDEIDKMLYRMGF